MSLNISLYHSDCPGLRQSHKSGQKRNLTRRQRKQVFGGLWLETAQSTGLWSPEFKSFLVLIVWPWKKSFSFWVSGFPLVDLNTSSFYCAPPQLSPRLWLELFRCQNVPWKLLELPQGTTGMPKDE